MDMAENEEKNDTQSPLSEKYQEHLIKSRRSSLLAKSIKKWRN